MSTSTRLLKYITPYSGTICAAMVCALLIACCEMGYVATLAEMIDTIKVIDTNHLPTSVVLFEDLPLQRDSMPSDIGETIALLPSLKRLYQPASGGLMVHLIDTNAALKMMLFIALGILILFLMKGILSFFHMYIISRVGQKLVLKLRDEFYGKLVHFPLGFFTERRAGDIMSRGTNDMARLHTSIQSMSDAVRAAATILVLVTIMVLKSWQLTLFTAAAFPPLIYIISQFGKRVKNVSALIQAKIADISSYLERTIFGIEVIKSFATEDWEKKRFTEENRAKYSVAMKRVRLSAYLVPFMEIITMTGMMAVFWFGFWQVITGRLTTGWFIGFITMVGMIYRHAKTLGKFNVSFQQAVASAERIFEIIDVQPEPHDAPDAVSLPEIRGDVVFKDVSFSYDGQAPVLNHINLKVKAGESIALVGPSGVGKTTLVSLLTRFYNVTGGEITIDDYPISRISLKSLRQHVGLVPQETVIFGGTARENIAYGRFDATEDEIIQAAKGANAHEFIAQLPDGYDTSIGEKGMQLSGGQRQRLAIARVILKDPHILILDEATSSLDTESEALVQEALANLMKGRTTFVIAHRLSTVVNADRIIVLNNGEIVESGTHSQLFAQNGLYRKLCDAQFRSAENNN